jgi:hypothetical protein
MRRWEIFWYVMAGVHLVVLGVGFIADGIWDSTRALWVVVCLLAVEVYRLREQARGK